MDIYQVPNTDFNNLTPEKAAEELSRLEAESSADVRHPYAMRSHPQHDDFVDYFHKLNNVSQHGGTLPEERTVSDMIGDGEQRESADKANIQAKLRAEAQVEIEALLKLDFDVDSLPKEIHPYHVEIWRMQRLAAEGNIRALGEMLLKENGAPKWINDFLNDPDMSDGEKIELIEARLPRILEYKKADYEATRPPTAAEIKAYSQAEEAAENEANSALVGGRSLAQIKMEIKQLETSPEFQKMLTSGYDKASNYEVGSSLGSGHEDLVAKRDALYRAAEIASEIQNITGTHRS